MQGAFILRACFLGVFFDELNDAVDERMFKPLFDGLIARR